MYTDVAHTPNITALKTCVYRPVPSWNTICTVPFRPLQSKACTIPFRCEKYMYRPVPSCKILPSRPVIKKESSLYFTVPSRREIVHPLSRPVPSRQLYIFLICRSDPSRLIFFPAKHTKTVPSRPVSNISSRVKPCKKRCGLPTLLEFSLNQLARTDWICWIRLEPAHAYRFAST